MENTAAKQDSGLLYQVPDSARLQHLAFKGRLGCAPLCEGAQTESMGGRSRFPYDRMNRDMASTRCSATNGNACPPRAGYRCWNDPDPNGGRKARGGGASKTSRKRAGSGVSRTTRMIEAWEAQSELGGFGSGISGLLDVGV